MACGTPPLATLLPVLRCQGAWGRGLALGSTLLPKAQHGTGTLAGGLALSKAWIAQPLSGRRKVGQSFADHRAEAGFRTVARDFKKR